MYVESGLLGKWYHPQSLHAGGGEAPQACLIAVLGHRECGQNMTPQHRQTPLLNFILDMKVEALICHPNPTPPSAYRHTLERTDK